MYKNKLQGVKKITEKLQINKYNIEKIRYIGKYYVYKYVYKQCNI